MLSKIINLIKPELLDWNVLSRHPDINMDIIKNNPDKPWNWYGVKSE